MTKFAPYGLDLLYQPRVGVKGGAITSAEVLVRVKDGHGGYLPTWQVIANIEREGHIDEFSLLVAERIVSDYEIMVLSLGDKTPKLSMNLSPTSLSRPDFCDCLHRIFSDASIPSDKIEFEITETILETDIEHFVSSCARLRELGHSLAIDDFGTGASGLMRLDMLPITTIKIDRHFVSGIRFRDTSRHIIMLITSFANLTGMHCIAEGVEVVEELDFVCQAGCTEIQGHIFFPAMPLNHLVSAVSFIAQNRCDVMRHRCYLDWGVNKNATDIRNDFRNCGFNQNRSCWQMIDCPCPVGSLLSA